MPDVTFLSVAGSGAVDETDFMSAWEEVQDAKVITFFLVRLRADVNFSINVSRETFTSYLIGSVRAKHLHVTK